VKDIDMLFVHPSTHCLSLGSRVTDLVTFVTMPIGTIALADLLERNGYSTKIFHTGIEQMYNRDFQVEDLFKKCDPRVVGIDLHWFVHSYDAIRIARIAKEQSNAHVVLGGFTASYFAEEILSSFDEVDSVIRGDAEVPLLELMKNLKNERLSNVPNLTYRRDGSLEVSEMSYIAGEDDLRQLNYTNFKLLSNYDKYHRAISQSGDLDPYAWKVNVKRQAWVPLGRGCTVNCSYCGGGSMAHYGLTGRGRPVFHPTEQVVQTLSKFEEEGIDATYMDFDPFPDRGYFRKLFEEIRKEKVDISTEFALWSLSDRGFIRDFADTFNPLYSTLVMSPESGSEEVRRKNKGFYFGNEELFRWLRDARREMVSLEVYFASGLCWETEENFDETINLAKSILDDYPVVTISCGALVMEPGSPRFKEPEKFGIKLKFGTFADYYKHFMGLAMGLPTETQLGYDTIWQSERQIVENSIRFEKMIGTGQPSRWLSLLDGEDVLMFKKLPFHS